MFTRASTNRSARALVHALAAAVIAVGLALVSVAFAQSAEAYYPKPVNTAVPLIKGVPAVGNKLVVTPGSWNFQPPLFITYAWSTPTKSLLSSSANYTVQPGDLGQVISVRVTATDGNNHGTTIVVKTPPITTSDVVSTSKPKFSGGMAVGDTVTVSTGKFTSGSGALTYAYEWTRTDGTTSTPIVDATSKYTITTADLGFFLSVTVTARSATQLGSVTGQTSGVAIPAVPYPSDASLTSSNRGNLSSKATKADVAAGTVTVTDPDGADAAGIFVYGYSNPTALGWFSLDSKKQLTVNFLRLTSGSHKLVLMDQSGKVVGWVPVVRPAPTGSLSGSANPLIAVAAVIVVLGIVVVIIVTNVRRRRLRRH